MYLKHAEMLAIVVHENMNFGGNPDQKKFSSLSNTAVVVMFPNFCFCDLVYAHTWELLTLKTSIEPPYGLVQPLKYFSFSGSFQAACIISALISAMMLLHFIKSHR